ncbi:MAG: AIM24 family protein [Candidatus Contendobacter sp.]|nr:AIM24 family protein [Candidatus Contendobacter sp.]
MMIRVPGREDIEMRRVFVHAGGTLLERELKAAETRHVDTGCLVAMQASVQFDIEMVGGITSARFGSRR